MDLCVCVCVVPDMESWDLNIKSNNSDHRTDLYGDKRLIVRRGQPFNILFHLKAGSAGFKLSETSFTVETGEPLIFCVDPYEGLCEKPLDWVASSPSPKVLYLEKSPTLKCALG